MNIYIANLSSEVNNDDLRELFEPYGEVISANVIKDKFTGVSRGFGFVEMKNDEEGQKAIDDLDRAEYDGKTISVSVARPRSERPSGGGSFNRGGGGGGGFGGNRGGGGGGGGYRDNRGGGGGGYRDRDSRGGGRDRDSRY